MWGASGIEKLSIPPAALVNPVNEKVAQMIRNAPLKDSSLIVKADGGTLIVPNCVQTKTPFSSKIIEENGGVDGTRTRGLCRDRAAF